MYDLAIVGGGATGYSAAMYAGRLSLKTIIFASKPGGLLSIAGKVENYPGFKSIDGFKLFQKIHSHAKQYSIIEKFLKIISITSSKSGSFFILETQDKNFKAKTVLLATGSQYRKLPIAEAEKFENKGVHYCALCDGFAYKDKVVAVIGGSDSAAKEALELAQHAKQVYIIIRGDRLKAENINQKKVHENPKIQLILKTNVIKLFGNENLEKIKLDNPFKGKQELELSGIFVAIGQKANSSLGKKLGLKLDKREQIVIDRYSQTNLPGVYAAGDVTGTEFKQLAIACAQAIVAVYKVFNYLKHQS